MSETPSHLPGEGRPRWRRWPTDSDGRPPKFSMPGVTAETLTRDLHDQCNVMILAALAEAGHPAESFWDGRRYAFQTYVPEWPLFRARVLVCDALGIPYEIEEPVDA